MHLGSCVAKRSKLWLVPGLVARATDGEADKRLVYSVRVYLVNHVRLPRGDGKGASKKRGWEDTDYGENDRYSKRRGWGSWNSKAYDGGSWGASGIMIRRCTIRNCSLYRYF